MRGRARSQATGGSAVVTEGKLESNECERQKRKTKNEQEMSDNSWNSRQGHDTAYDKGLGDIYLTGRGASDTQNMDNC